MGQPARAHLIDTQLVHSAALTIAPLVPPSTTTSGTPAPRHVSGDQQDEQRTLPTTLTRLTSLRRLSLCLGPGAALPVLAAAAPQLQHLHLELRCLALSPELIISVANSFPGMLSLSLAGLSTRSVPMQPTQPWRQALSTLPVTLHTLHLASIDQDGWYRRTWLSDTRDLAGLSHLTTLTDLRLTGVACPPLLPPSVCLSELKPLLNAPNARLQHLTIAAVPSSRLSLAFLSQCAASGPALHLALAASPSQLRAAAAADTGWQGAWQRVRTLWLRALTEDLSPADVTSLLSSLPNLRELQSSCPNSRCSSCGGHQPTTCNPVSCQHCWEAARCHPPATWCSPADRACSAGRKACLAYKPIAQHWQLTRVAGPHS